MRGTCDCVGEGMRDVEGALGSSDGRERWYRYDGIFQGKRAGGEPKHMLGNAENRVVPFAEWRALGEKLPKTGSG